MTQDIQHFIDHGFIKIENAFSKTLADECRAILWKATGCDPNDRDTWTEPVIRIGELHDPCFAQAANTTLLHEAFDKLVGPGNWLPKGTLGAFPIRFPSALPAPDTGWHVDGSFPGENAKGFFDWRINVQSKGRGLLMLFLFSDVGENDAPTRIRAGSHLDVAKLLSGYGEDGLSFMELAAKLEHLPDRKEALATGKAGTVYLCHPFVVHAAQDHHGASPKFMAQPALHLRNDFNIDPERNNHSAVELAIIKAILARNARIITNDFQANPLLY